MRPRPTFLCVLFATAVCVLGSAAPASAKGATKAVITGLGLAHPIVIGSSEPGSFDHRLERLAASSGFYVEVWGGTIQGHRALPHQPAGDLGLRYAITYTMVPVHQTTHRIVQYVYPYAKPHPFTYTAPGQLVWSGTRTTGGWFRARSDLTRLLVSAGLPATPPASVSASPPSGAPTPASSGSSLPVAWLVAAVGVVLGAVLVISRRRRTRVTGTA